VLDLFRRIFNLICFQDAIVDKWALKDPSLVEYDDRLQYYVKTATDVGAMNLFKDQDCIRLHMGSLVDSIKRHAKEWINTYGRVLQDSASTRLGSLSEQLAVQ